MRALAAVGRRGTSIGELIGGWSDIDVMMVYRILAG
jgi:hypothetical protein